MSILRESLVLDAAVEIVDVEQLDEGLREQLGAQEGDMAVSRAAARVATTLIDAEGAALLLHFRRPESVARAMVRFARALGDPPEEVLTASLPLLKQMLQDGVLRIEGSADPPSLSEVEAGSRIGGFEIVEPVQAFEDSGVFLARGSEGFVALKVAPAISDAVRQMDPGFIREAELLRRLGGLRVVPEIVAHGTDGEHAYLAVAWRSGAPVTAVALTLRRDGDAAGLLDLMVRITGAYAELHGAGILHGDVHPGNILVDADGSVTILDLGVATTVDDPPRARAGVPFYREPEFARATLDGDRPPLLTAAGEQYAVAAVLYELAAGQPPGGQLLNEADLMRAIAERPAPPLPAGSPLHGELDPVLRTALASVAEDRYPDVATFRDALAAVERPPAPTPAPDANWRSVSRFVAGMLAYVDVRSDLYTKGLAGPTATISSGAGGIAAGLLWLAVGRADPRLMDHARCWSQRALQGLDDRWAFEHADAPIPAQLTTASLLHHRGGVHVVSALLDLVAGGKCTAEGLADVWSGADADGDLTLGNLGIVLGGALLTENLGRDAEPEADEHPAVPSAERIRNQLQDEWSLGRDQAAKIDETRPNLGLAHGLAGVLFAALRWSAASGDELPADAEELLATLLRQLLPAGRGQNIPWNLEAGAGRSAARPRMPGWCNGAAGILHLLCLSEEVVGDGTALEAAEPVAWHVLDAPEGVHDLCCGAAGRAAVLARFGALADAPAWVAQARRMVARAVDRGPDLSGDEHPPSSLFKGSFGLAVVADVLDAGRLPAIPMLDPLP